LQPSKKAVVKAAERICANTPGMAAEAAAAFNEISADIMAKYDSFQDRVEISTTARLAMLKSIIEGNDIQSAALDGRKAIDL
jgi:hypothetical protein